MQQNGGASNRPEQINIFKSKSKIFIFLFTAVQSKDFYNFYFTNLNKISVDLQRFNDERLHRNVNFLMDILIYLVFMKTIDFLGFAVDVGIFC
jgi:hypothetical protein